MWSHATGAQMAEGVSATSLSTVPASQPVKIGRFTVVKECDGPLLCSSEQPPLPVILPRCGVDSRRQGAGSPLPRKLVASAPAAVAALGRASSVDSGAGLQGEGASMNEAPAASNGSCAQRRRTKSASALRRLHRRVVQRLGCSAQE
eukprot:gb/GFBE01070392.1/.p1 GENE.gb/GFBE01070392.1/~~gb/GFBE01070392.1/.p1  ORF type:complete len:147 (+),score=12.38 gb/GFBE01070392.1/:1-441(+)